MKKLAAVWLILFAVGLLAGPVSAAERAPKSRLARVNIPAVDFKDKTFREALDALGTIVKQADPEHYDPSFVLAVPPAVADRRITLKVDAGDALTALRRLVGIADCNLRIEPSAHVIWEQHAPPLPPLRVEKGGEASLAKMMGRYPRVEFKESTFREAIEYLIIRSSPIDSPPIPLIPRPTGNPELRISIGFISTSVPEVIRYICAIAEVECSFGPEGWKFTEPKRRLASAPIAELDLKDATLREALDVLAAMIMKADPKRSDPNFVLAVPPPVAERKITFKKEAGDSLERIREVVALAGCEVQLELHGTVIREKGAGPLPRVRVEKGVKKLSAYVERLRFPKLDFRDATVREAVDFLVTNSKQIAPQGGVSVVIKLDDSPTPATLITLSATDLPASDAFRYLAGTAGLEVSIGKFAIELSRPAKPAESAPKK